MIFYCTTSHIIQKGYVASDNLERGNDMMTYDKRVHGARMLGTTAIK